MVTRYITKEIEVEVDVDLSAFDTNELIEEIEARTGRFMIDNDDSGSISEAAKDEIYTFYRDYLLWKDVGMSNENFEKIANKFFGEYLGVLVN